MYFSLHFEELHALNSMLIVLHFVAELYCMALLVSARYIQPVSLMGGAAFCFGAASGAFIIAAGNLCKDFDVSYK